MCTAVLEQPALSLTLFALCLFTFCSELKRSPGPTQELFAINAHNTLHTKRLFCVMSPLFHALLAGGSGKYDSRCLFDVFAYVFMCR